MKTIKGVINRKVVPALVGTVVMSLFFIFGGRAFYTSTAAIENTNWVFLPFVLKEYPPFRPFAVETGPLMLEGSKLLTRAQELGAQQARLNRVSWRSLQPNESDPIQWTKLAGLENELRALKAAGIVPHIIVDDYPVWATDNTVRTDGQPTSCGPLREDKIAAFAAFMAAVVQRLSAPAFDVHIWELGNEPDVDPNLVDPNMIYGCWGKMSDPYYGGERYGRMVIAVSTAIKQKDPTAQVLIGGLLLDRPDSAQNPQCPNCGRPEMFFEGILKAGAGPYLDGVPYHAYPPYLNRVTDHDMHTGGLWDSWGGYSLGKARFLRQVMQRYHINKPLYLNEIALTCPEYSSWCFPPSADFYEAQANFLVRSFPRALSEDIRLISWYTLEGPGWRYSGILDQNNNPTPTFWAYQQLIKQLDNKRYRGQPAYGEGVEAYSFAGSHQAVHVVWMFTAQTGQIIVPTANFIAAYDRNGNRLMPTPTSSGYQLPVGFSPIYVQVRQP